MSSVSSSDESRKVREEYLNREAENLKKQKNTVKKINQEHAAELEKLKNQYLESTESLRGKQKELYTERDRRHNDEVGKVKDTFLESMRRKAEENDRQMEEFRDSYEGMIAKEKRIGEQQKDRLTRSFKEGLDVRSEELSNATGHARQEMKQAIANQSEKMRSKHDKELTAVTSDRDRLVQEMQNQAGTMKSNYETERQRKDIRQSAALENQEKSFKQKLDNMEERNNHMLGLRDQVVQNELERMRNKYQENLQKKNAEMDAAREQLSDSVEKHSRAEYNSMANRLDQERNIRGMEASANKKQTELQKENLVRSYEDRINAMEGERKLIYNEANELTSKRVDAALEKADKLVQDTNRRHQLEVGARDLRNHEDRLNMEHLAEQNVNHIKEQSDERVSRIMKTAAQIEKDSQKIITDREGQLKDLYVERLQGQRETQADITKKAEIRNENRFKEIQKANEKRFQNMVEFYQGSIDKLKDQHEQDVKRLVNQYEERMTSRDKAAKMEVETSELKLENRVSQLNEVHEKEIERMERRHQEQMSSLATRVNSNKKS